MRLAARNGNPASPRAPSARLADRRRRARCRRRSGRAEVELVVADRGGGVAERVVGGHDRRPFRRGSTRACPGTCRRRRSAARRRRRAPGRRAGSSRSRRAAPVRRGRPSAGRRRADRWCRRSTASPLPAPPVAAGTRGRAAGTTGTAASNQGLYMARQPCGVHIVKALIYGPRQSPPGSALHLPVAQARRRTDYFYHSHRRIRHRRELHGLQCREHATPPAAAVRRFRELVWIANRDTSGLSGQTTQVGHVLDLRERTRSLSALAGYFAFYGVGDNLLSGTASRSA